MVTQTVDELETLVLNNWEKFKDVEELSHTFYNKGGWELDSAIHLVAATPETTTIYDLIEEEDLFGYSVDTIFIRFVEVLTQLRMDVNRLAASKVNLLNTPDESAGWEARYRHALALHVSSHGSPATWGDGFYGWHDYSFATSNPGRYVVAVVKVKTDSWDEFEGTFTGASNHTGVVADCVFSDGSQRRMRWDGEASELIRSITKE